LFPCGKHALPGVRAKLHLLIKHILRNYVCPSGKQEQATMTVLKQVEMFASDWAL